MFTGIVEATGTVRKIDIEGTNKTFTIEAPFIHEMKVNDSLSHNGVCLTIVHIAGNTYQVTAVQETLIKSNLGELIEGDIVNLEPAAFENKVEQALREGTRGHGRGFVLMPSASPVGEELAASAIHNYESMIRLAESFSS